jgi:hypothetical protein
MSLDYIRLSRGFLRIAVHVRLQRPASLEMARYSGLENFSLETVKGRHDQRSLL